jgi:hypothetical protein
MTGNATRRQQYRSRRVLVRIASALATWDEARSVRSFFMMLRRLAVPDFHGMADIVARSLRMPPYRLELRFRMVVPMQHASNSRCAALATCSA